MSDLHIDFERQEMEANGEMDFIRQHVAAAQGEEVAAPAPADTVEVPAVDSEEGEIPTDVGTEADPEPLSEAEEEVLYLDLDDDTQALIDDKYGGDLNKALTALRESQSLIGRQGNELGELRKQIEEGLEGLRGDIVRAQPYPEWPDEFAEPAEAAMQFRAIAEAAFSREDVDTFSSVVDAWVEVDPLSANMYRDLKLVQLQSATQAHSPAPMGNPEEVLSAGVAEVQAEFPQMMTPEFKAELDAELAKFPSLKGLLWGEIPGTTPEQRIAALRETVTRVASRHVAETEEKARRRVAVKRSEEARQARIEGKVASGESARTAEPEVEARVVPMGNTGRALNIDRLNAMLNPEDRI